MPDPQPPHRQDVDAYWVNKITKVIRDQFGIKPKVNTYSYRTLYPPAYDLISLPNRYKVPDFTKFSGQDDTSTMEHVNRFIIQCGEATNRDVSVFSPRGVTPTSKFVCVLPFPDGDARRHRGLSWFGQEKALRPAGGESLYYRAPKCLYRGEYKCGVDGDGVSSLYYV